MTQYILIGRDIPEAAPAKDPIPAEAGWPVIRDFIGRPSAFQMRVAVDVFCKAVYGQHQWEDTTHVLNDGKGILWLVGRCKHCATVQFVPKPVPQKEPLVQLA